MNEITYATNDIERALNNDRPEEALLQLYELANTGQQYTLVVAMVGKIVTQHLMLKSKKSK